MKKFTLELNAAKNIDVLKNTLNKSCTELNLLEKTQRMLSQSNPVVKLGAPRIFSHFSAL